MTGEKAGGGHRVTVTDHLWIPMSDGVRLAARLWLPEGAKASPVPAILEYIPYRKADMVRARDERNHPFFAAHGYACLRVDMRGSGDSEGHMPDMYSDDELADARHVIDWIASQPWCDGQVGMFGTSWGGTASLQANIDAPEALKAVIAVCATHDRYEDDIHHMGGCVLTDTFEWGATLPVILAAPPTPNVGPDWQALWQERLDRLSFPVEAWLREEARGRYWRHGSVIHQAQRLTRPVLAVGGWSDRYSNSVMSLVSARPDLVWGIVGPWGHHYPDHGHPGPAIGFQQVALEWWDRWMKPQPVVPEWPKLRLWLREFDPPADAIEMRNGRWIETGPPEVCTSARVLHLWQGKLEPDMPALGAGWSIPHDLEVGQASGDTGYFGRFGGLPLDQQADDARALNFQTPPTEEDLVLCGAALARFCVQAGAAGGQVALRLNDVAPDGTSARIAFAVRNLALDYSLDEPEQPVRDGEREVEIPFPTVAYRLRKGHRLRLSVSSSYWPLIWPSRASDVRLVRGALTVPVFDACPRDLRQPFPPALDLPVTKSHSVLTAPALQRTQTEDGPVRVNGWKQPFTELRYEETQTDFGFETRAEHRIARGDPETGQSVFEHRQRYRRPDGIAEIACALAARTEAGAFQVKASLTVDWDGERVKSRDWSVSIPIRHG